MGQGTALVLVMAHRSAEAGCASGRGMKTNKSLQPFGSQCPGLDGGWGTLNGATHAQGRLPGETWATGPASMRCRLHVIMRADAGELLLYNAKELRELLMDAEFCS